MFQLKYLQFILVAAIVQQPYARSWPPSPETSQPATVTVQTITADTLVHSVEKYFKVRHLECLCHQQHMYTNSAVGTSQCAARQKPM